MAEYETKPYERGKATIGSCIATMVKMGMNPISAFRAGADVGRCVKRDDENRPYLQAVDGKRWFVDIPGETAEKAQ